ncbi:MAG: ribonuclease HII [Deltaproteobacteria bacterium]|nr:ribonuclease HII [Deltaproteobacteria bacterium]
MAKSKNKATVAEITAKLAYCDDRELQQLNRDCRCSVRNLVRREQVRRVNLIKEKNRLAHLLTYEQPLWHKGLQYIAGVDEAGVGPLAGPVVAAAVVLPIGCSIEGINDSKKLSARKRDTLAQQIKNISVAYAIAHCSVNEIDNLNIYHAALEAMRRAVVALNCSVQHLLVDARRIPKVDIPQTAIISGDAKSQSIAAASILAKTHRDQLMCTLAQKHPGYGLEKHKGYGTAEHIAAIKQLGPASIHRRSFRPVSQLTLYTLLSSTGSKITRN